VQDVRQQLNQIEQRNPNMKPLEALYAQQILKRWCLKKRSNTRPSASEITVSDSGAR